VTALAVAYYSAAEFGIQFATLNTAASLLWPATGVSMAALFLGGWRLWPGILMGAFAFSFFDGKSPAVAFLIALGNTGEALLAWVACRYGSRFAREGEQPRDFVFFALAGGLLATLASAVLGGWLAMLLVGLPGDITALEAAVSWWVGNVIGAILVTPMILGLVRRSEVPWDARQMAEAAPLVIALGAIAWWVFQSGLPADLHPLPAAFLLFPFMVWLSNRFGTRGGALGTLVAAIFAIQGTAQGSGPFGGREFPLNLILLQTLLLVLAFTSYSLSYAAEARWRAERRANLAAQQIQLHVDHSPLGVIEWNDRFEVVEWNPAAEKIFGWERQEALGRHAWFIVPEEHRAAVESVWAGLLGSGGGRRSTNANLDRSGNRLICDWYNLPLRGDHGRVIGVISLVEDVSERHRVAQESRELERKMLEAQKLESLGVLAGGIAHDFNNLLTGILGNASLARLESPPHAAAQESLAEIETSAQRAADLCRQMLAYSGRGKFVVEPLDLNALIRDTLPLIRLSLSKRAEVVSALAETLPLIEADATQIRQVIMNLVINASDALGERSGRVRLSTRVVALDRDGLAALQFGQNLAAGNYVELEVADDGEGMTAEVRARIFEPFFTTKFSGRGLGLAAVLGIVRGHQAALSVASEPGWGTSFRIYWPVDAHAQDRARDATEECPSEWRGGGRALVVDDEDAVRVTTARMLRSLGFDTTLASGGREGLALFRAHPEEWSVVLLDLTMPELDGTQVHRQLKSTRPEVPVLLMSGFSEQDALRRFGEQGVVAFLQKPFTLDSLRNRLRQLLESRPP
jgi:PAS domain S-box-containing protein